MKTIIIILTATMLLCRTQIMNAQESLLCPPQGTNEFCDLVAGFGGLNGPPTEFGGKSGALATLLGIALPGFRAGGLTSVTSWGAQIMCHPCFQGAIDPNAKYGVGNNFDNVHTAMFSVPYSIHFENLPAATAPAAEVWVLDTIHPDKFDFSSLRYGPIHIGELVIEPFEGDLYTNFKMVDLRESHGIDLKVEVRFDTVSGIVKWHFMSFDTNTYDLVSDPELGFLPPNGDGVEGTGSVSFYINRKNLPSGDSIPNTSSIIFDSNEPIQTPEWLIVVDTTPPVSNVSSLPAISPSTFEVSWNGNDEHAGVLHYDIYAAENDNPLRLWIRNTTSENVQFIGNDGSTYKFYAIATDRAFNREPLPLDPQNPVEAITVVNACLDDINTCDNDSDGISSADGDCDDSNPGINPLAPEVCNGIDDNCNGLIDDADPAIQGQLVWYIDTDNDGFGDSEFTQLACIQPEGFTGTGTDCDDNNDDVFPDAEEMNDGLDNDCDGTVDEGFSTLSADAGDCDMVYRGYGPAGCTMLTVVVQGGVSPYTFAWSNGTTTESTIVCPEETTIYTVVVSDQNGNTTQDAVTVQVVDIRCGNNNNKVSVCHIPPENPANAHTLCISESAVAAHLDEHGDYLGVCNAEDPCGGSQSLAFMPELIFPLDDNVKLEALLTDDHEVNGADEATGLANEIEVFPNPTEGNVYIRIPSNVKGEARLIMQDLSGHVLAGKIVHESQILIDLSPFPSGLYVINVIAADGNWQKMIMKAGSKE